MIKLRNKALILSSMLLASLSLQAAYACISKEYNDAYASFKHGQYSESFPAFTKLFNQGCPTSAYFLGIYYTYGIAVKQNYDTAIMYFAKFLDKKNLAQPRDYRANAYLALALIYKSKNQMQKAHDYLVDSAKLGNAEAIFLLGRSYLDKTQPYYIQSNLKEAYLWLNKAANYGNIQAMKLIDQHSLQKNA